MTKFYGDMLEPFECDCKQVVFLLHFILLKRLNQYPNDGFEDSSFVLNY